MGAIVFVYIVVALCILVVAFICGATKDEQPKP